MSHETELKLSYTPEALARLKQSAEVRRLARGSARAQRLRTIYFDTTDTSCASRPRAAAWRASRSGASGKPTSPTTCPILPPSRRAPWIRS